MSASNSPHFSILNPIILVPTSRTAVQDYKFCPRYRFLAHLIGRDLSASPPVPGGIVSAHPSVHLLIGTAVHEVMEVLGREVMAGRTGPASPEWREVVCGAVNGAVAGFRHAAGPQGENLRFGFKVGSAERENPDAGILQFKRAEAQAMVEALGLTAGLVLLPRLLRQYRILEVEQEKPAILCEWREVDGEGEAPTANALLVLNSRADYILEPLEAGDWGAFEAPPPGPVIFSLKTKTGTWDAKAGKQFKRDMQGMSEIWCARNTYKGKRYDAVQVQMGVLCKGWEGRQDSLFAYNTPLLQCWRAEGLLGAEWAWRYKIPKPANKSGWGNLPASYRQFPVWDPVMGYPGGVRQWILDLVDGKIQPELGMDPFGEIVALPLSWARSEVQIERWRRQTTVQEAKLAEAAAQIELTQDRAERERLLDEYFSLNEQGCMSRFGAECEYDQICWERPGLEGGEWAAELVGDGERWKMREDHHEVLGLEG